MRVKFVSWNISILMSYCINHDWSSHCMRVCKGRSTESCAVQVAPSGLGCSCETPPSLSGTHPLSSILSMLPSSTMVHFQVVVGSRWGNCRRVKVGDFRLIGLLLKACTTSDRPTPALPSHLHHFLAQVLAGILNQIDSRSEGLVMPKNQNRRSLRIWEKRIKQLENSYQTKGIGIDVLHDDVLLEIFDFYLHKSPLFKRIEIWQVLVHVCRRWRSLVLRSPRRLNLRIFCSPQTPAKDKLDVWPAFPTSSSGTDNVIAALGQSDRVCEVFLWGITSWQLAEVLGPMQVPFPELTRIQLLLRDGTPGTPPPVIPGSFLGGSAPSLKSFDLEGIPFPGLPILLQSANHLVFLRFTNIPHSGYNSPEAMAALFSVLSSLETLCLAFESPQSRPDWQSRSLPPPKRSILPALKKFHFKGVTEYLEELVTHIDTPQLDQMHITFFNQIDFDCPRLAQFINCTSTFRPLDEARVQFRNDTASVELRYLTSQSGLDGLEIVISCREPDWQLSSIEQVSNSLRSLSSVEDLYIEHYSELVWKNDGIENTLWLQLLLPFTAVKNLYLSKGFAPGIAAALEELVRGRITEVLPRLQNIFVEGLEPSGSFQENIGRFDAARQFSGHPITISLWKTEILSG